MVERMGGGDRERMAMESMKEQNQAVTPSQSVVNEMPVCSASTVTVARCVVGAREATWGASERTMSADDAPVVTGGEMLRNVLRTVIWNIGNMR